MKLQLIISKKTGFCGGVERAVRLARENISGSTYAFGEITHNTRVVEELESAGLKTLTDAESIPDGSRVIIRSHGAGEAEINAFVSRGCEIIDATCPLVKRIHGIAKKHAEQGFTIAVIGSAEHPEVKGICGWASGRAVVIGADGSGIEALKECDNICVVAQTTLEKHNFHAVVKLISNLRPKILEIFDTICYTTLDRQAETERISALCDITLVIGGKHSSNTRKLLMLAAKTGKPAYIIENIADVKNLKLNGGGKIGIVAGTSAPKELVREVTRYMSDNFTEASNQDFLEAVNQKAEALRPGKRVSVAVISADEKGVSVELSTIKHDGFIPAEEMELDGTEYNPSNYKTGDIVHAIIKSAQRDKDSGCWTLSKREVDLIKETDKIIDTIRDGSEFSLTVNKDTKGGLLGKMGSYTVFIPASQLKAEGYPRDIKDYLNKPLRLTALEIDDDRRKIVASQKKILLAEKAEAAESFWNSIEVNTIVRGVVKRATSFGVFVDVNGFDCLAHIGDLSWTRVAKAEDVLELEQEYDFLVLAADREKNKVSLGYKQLMKNPFELALEKYSAGDVVKGTVVRLVPFGAFVELEKGVDALLHVSEASNTFVKNITDVFKVGDEIEAIITKIEPENRKISLSVKALLPEIVPEEPVADEQSADREGDAQPKEIKRESRTQKFTERQERVAPGAPKSRKINKEATRSEGIREWSEDSINTPFSDLLKNLQLEGDKEEESKEEANEEVKE